MAKPEPRIVVLTTLFPHAGQPTAGLFIRERMFRVARVLPVTVVAPAAVVSAPGVSEALEAALPPAVRTATEIQEGIEVRRPRFLSVPGAFKWLDGFFHGAVPACRPCCASSAPSGST